VIGALRRVVQPSLEVRAELAEIMHTPGKPGEIFRPETSAADSRTVLNLS
jgi:hypothetical protein